MPLLDYFYKEQISFKHICLSKNSFLVCFLQSMRFLVGQFSEQCLYLSYEWKHFHEQITQIDLCLLKKYKTKVTKDKYIIKSFCYIFYLIVKIFVKNSVITVLYVFFFLFLLVPALFYKLPLNLPFSCFCVFFFLNIVIPANRETAKKIIY